MESSVDLVVQVNKVGRQHIHKIVQTYVKTYSSLFIKRFQYDPPVLLLKLKSAVLTEVALLDFFNHSLQKLNWVSAWSIDVVVDYETEF